MGSAVSFDDGSHVKGKESRCVGTSTSTSSAKHQALPMLPSGAHLLITTLQQGQLKATLGAINAQRSHTAIAVERKQRPAPSPCAARV